MRKKKEKRKGERVFSSVGLVQTVDSTPANYGLVAERRQATG